MSLILPDYQSATSQQILNFAKEVLTQLEKTQTDLDKAIQVADELCALSVTALRDVETLTNENESLRETLRRVKENV